MRKIALVSLLVSISFTATAPAEPKPTVSCVGTCYDLELSLERDCDFVMAVDGASLEVFGLFPFTGSYSLWPNPVPGYGDADRTDEKRDMYYRMYIKRLAGLIEIERSKISSDGGLEIVERFKGACRKADPIF